MNTFDIILQQVGLFVIYILAGLLLVKTKVLNRETLEPISKFVIKMALPLMVFINITDGTDKKNLYESWPILVIAVGFDICIYAAGSVSYTQLPKKHVLHAVRNYVDPQRISIRFKHRK